MSIKALSDYTFYSKYAKHLPEKKRRETWRETVTRVFDMHREKYANELQNNELEELFGYAEEALLHKKILGSQRALQFGGKAILDKNERIYNCSSGYIDRPRAFQEVFFLLLCGTGVGFSVQTHHINKLPKVKSRGKGKKTYVIPDSIEGWADSVGVLMSSYMVNDQPFPEYAGYEIEFDFSQIRPKGAFISWGGIAPGPDGLKKSLDRSANVIDRRLSRGQEPLQLPAIDVYDIIMHVSDAVLSGGVRRSATICLFSPDDEEMSKAKIGDWYINNPQRARSNNSAVLVRNETSKEEFISLLESTKKFGEPGFVWTEHKDITVNPCVEIGMWPQTEEGESGWQFCNLTEINGKKVKTKEAFFDACKAASILGTIQAGYAKFAYLGEATEKITQREALLGVSITGMMDNPDIIFDDEIQKEGAQLIRETNKKVAKLLGINQAARTTCVKPAGSSSCVLGSASGIHPHHSTRYFRRVQANKMEFPARHYAEKNPSAVEESVWSANDTDLVVNFLCEVPDGSKTKNQLSAIDLLEHVKLTQNNWVEYGTNKSLCMRPFIRHNVSNTITVKPDEWEEVGDYIYRNRKSFAGISLLGFSGDKDYDQAPFCAVFNPKELIKMYGDASVFASGLIVDGLHTFDSLFKACDTALGFGETLSVERLREHILDCKDAGTNGFEVNGKHISANSADELLEVYLQTNVKFLAEKRDWVRRATQFADRYFEGDVRQMTYCLKDVSNWKKWCDLKREHQEVDWTDVVEESHFIKVDEMGAQACSGGKCEIF